MKETEKLDKYLNLNRKNNETGNCYANCCWSTGNDPKMAELTGNPEREKKTSKLPTLLKSAKIQGPSTTESPL